VGDCYFDTALGEPQWWNGAAWVGAGGGGGVTSVTGTAPIASSGGATPDISIAAATQTNSGSMSAVDKGRVDNVGMLTTYSSTPGIVPSEFGFLNFLLSGLYGVSLPAGCAFDITVSVISAALDAASWTVKALVTDDGFITTLIGNSVTPDFATLGAAPWSLSVSAGFGTLNLVFDTGAAIAQCGVTAVARFARSTPT
jgi:hypothetical protein